MRPGPRKHPILYASSSEINNKIVSVSLFRDDGNDSFHAHGCVVVPTESRGTLLRAKEI